MALQDYFNTGDNDYVTVDSTTWWSETFTAGSSYTCSSIRAKLFKTGTPTGTVTLYLLGVTAGLPDYTNKLLATGTYSIASLTTTPGAFVEFVLDTPVALTSGVLYAIAIKASTTGVGWRAKSGGTSYPGTSPFTTDGGTSWNAYSYYDFMFETYDAAAGTTYNPTGVIDNISTLSGTVTKGVFYSVSVIVNNITTLTGSLQRGAIRLVTGIIANVYSLRGRLSNVRPPFVPTPLVPTRPTGYDPALTSGGGGALQEKIVIIGHKVIYVGDLT